MEGAYPKGVTVSNAEMAELNHRLIRSATLPKYDITIKPKPHLGK